MIKILLLIVSICMASNFARVRVGSADTLKIWDGVQIMEMDNATGAIKNIDYDHSEIHSGSSFCYSGIATINSGDSVSILITTKDTLLWSHCIFYVSVSGAATISLHEAVTVSDTGASRTAGNRNRNITRAATTKINYDPVITNAGTLLGTCYLGEGRKTGDRFRGEEEFILKQNTKYVFRILSEAAGNRVSVMIDWYEHRNKND